MRRFSYISYTKAAEDCEVGSAQAASAVLILTPEKADASPRGGRKEHTEMIRLTDNSKCGGAYAHGHRKCAGKGPTSFHMQSPQLVFDRLMLKNGATFLDLGCGAGDYSLFAAKIVGKAGKVYSVDISRDNVDRLCRAASDIHIGNVFAECGNITNTLNYESDSIDVCLISTVLHIFGLTSGAERMFREIRRVLKPEGRLSIIECKKEPMSFGPPMEMRLSPEELRAVVEPIGFEVLDYTDLGVNYMIMFKPVS